MIERLLYAIKAILENEYGGEWTVTAGGEERFET